MLFLFLDLNLGRENSIPFESKLNGIRNRIMTFQNWFFQKLNHIITALPISLTNNFNLYNHRKYLFWSCSIQKGRTHLASWRQLECTCILYLISYHDLHSTTKHFIVILSTEIWNCRLSDVAMSQLIIFPFVTFWIIAANVQMYVFTS